MNNKLEELLNNEEVNLKELEKPLFEFFKECVKKQIYSFDIGAYHIDIEPNKLLVSYEYGGTYIEVSNEDYYEEQIRTLDTTYYIIDDNKSFIFDMDTPYIKITEEVLNMDGIYSDNYYLELNNNKIFKIDDFIKNKSINKLNDDNAILSFDIDKDTKRINIEDYLDMNKLKYAYYSLANNIFEVDEKKNLKIEKEFYKNIFPDINKHKKIVESLYKYMINFYKDFFKGHE